MTVREVINESAELLGIDLTESKIDILVNCYNHVENELAIDYFPLRTDEKVLIKECKIKYEDLQRQAWRIMGVHDCDNHELKYKLYPPYMVFAKKDNGKHCFVRYCYLPKEKTIDGISEFDEGMFKDTLKYGVCAEYCLLQGDYEQASLWTERYKKAINMYWFKWKSKGV